MEINGRRIGAGMPPYMIAEISGNHLGSFRRATELMDAAIWAGADAIKFQYYTPDSITIDHDGPGFVLEDGPWKGRKLYELYQEAHTPPEWFPNLFSYARDMGITAFASVFDMSSVDQLERLGVPAYKISSFDIGDLPLLHHVNSTGNPVIVSTGMASEEEILNANDAINSQKMFFHCVSGYPTPASEAQLWRIAWLRSLLGAEAIVGISDHTLGHDVAVAATALNVAAIEKHFTLLRSDGGADAEFSMEPEEFRDMTMAVRAINSAMREGNAPSKSESASLILRKSIYAVSDIAPGEIFTKDNIRIIRPSLGLAPKYYHQILGEPANKAYRWGDPITLNQE